MKKIATITLLTVLLVNCKGDDRKSQNTTVDQHGTKGTIPESYQFTSRIESQRKTFGNQDIAFFLSNTGQYFEAMQNFDRDFPEAADDVFYDSTNFNFYPAVDYIVSAAKQYQVVIINEAHHVSYHRFFTRLLLEKLKKIGFNYFGAETLIAADTLLEKRGYPVLNTGYYTTEPQFGNLIREALAQGYNIFAYEATSGANGREREIEQARNIAKILKADTNARILLHCGYGHIAEDEVEGWGKAMAGRLTEFTGIDPLTIDQVELTEHSDIKHENPYFRKMKFNEFVIPVNNGKMVLGSLRMDGHPSDLFVYHPRTHLMYGRPHWLFAIYKPVLINDKISLSYPVLAKAYLANEDRTQAVPFDVIQIKSSDDTTALALSPNKRYNITVENEAGQKQDFDFDF